MGKRSKAARNERWQIKRRFAREKAKAYRNKDKRSIQTQPQTPQSCMPSKELAETEPPSPELFPNCGDADNIDQWSASSPPSTDTEDPVDMGIDEQSASMASCIRKATEGELPMIVAYRTGSIQVHISPNNYKEPSRSQSLKAVDCGVF